jgi:hypothetical protein
LDATVAELTPQPKEQDSKIQKMSDRLEMSEAASQVGKINA